jgi:hypothetical protein
MPLAKTRHFDQIVINHGTLPLDDLYFELRPHSSPILARSTMTRSLRVNRKHLNGGPADGQGFQLFRIGDAIAARNTHAAIYDALRLVKEI